MKTIYTQACFKDLLSKDDIRPCLNYVYFNKQKNALVITNGHALLEVVADVENDLESMPDECLIPISAFPKNARENKHGLWDISAIKEDNEFKITVHTGQDTRIFKVEIDQVRAGKRLFPDCDAVFPEIEDKEPINEIGLSPIVYSQFNGFFKHFHLNGFKMQFFGENKAIFLDLDDNQKENTGFLRGLIMPVMIDY